MRLIDDHGQGHFETARPVWNKISGNYQQGKQNSDDKRNKPKGPDQPPILVSGGRRQQLPMERRCFSAKAMSLIASGKAMIGRKLSQGEAKRLLGKLAWPPQLHGGPSLCSVL
jgi:hypothetical protein